MARVIHSPRLRAEDADLRECAGMSPRVPVLLALIVSGFAEGTEREGNRGFEVATEGFQS